MAFIESLTGHQALCSLGWQMSRRPPVLDMTVHQTKIQSELGCSLVTSPRGELTPPAPRDKYARWDFNILQVNMDGFKNRQVELMKMLHDNKINIALLQETVLSKKE